MFVGLKDALHVMYFTLCWLQGIRKDHVEFQYSAANQAKGLKGDQRTKIFLLKHLL